MSNDTFKNNPELKEYFETSDGQKFYKQDLAKNHARNLEDKEVKHVERPEAVAVQETAADIIAKAPQMDLDTANEYLDAETSLEKPRKSVVAALEKRINELENEA